MKNKQNSLLFAAALSLALLLPAACGRLSRETVDLRRQYGDILDISYTPTHPRSRCGGAFVDQGSWMGFTTPQRGSGANGFCGPFNLDSRRWLAQTAVNVGAPSVPADAFALDTACYYPGEVTLQASSPAGTIVQEMVFVDATTALLRIKSNIREGLTFTGSRWAEGTTFAVAHNVVSATHPSGETTCISFTPDVEVSLTADNYRATYTDKRQTYVVLSFFWNEKEKMAGIQKAATVLAHPQQYMDEAHTRWNNYLSATLRPDMPHRYNRIAAKAVVTLLSNWKTHKGGLLHEGVVPSHGVNYFMGFWAWDSWRFAVALAPFAPELSKNQIRAMFDYQLPDGMIIDCIYSNPDENNARDSKPPLAAWAVDAVFTHTADTAFVREMYPQLLAYHRWWYAKRDHNGNGICEFGSVDGTTEAAAWESGMDNAIRFDDARMVRNGADDAWSFDQESVDLNAYLALEYRLLKKFAAIIGQPFAEPDHTAQVADYFFDPTVGYFFDRRLADGSFVRVEGCEGYTPFWTGIATPAQMERALTLFTDTAKFSTYIPFPTVAADEPKFMPKGYWRGPIWLDQTYFAIKGLRNYGHADLADRYTLQVFDRLQGLTADAPIHENYGTHTGERLKAPHFSWSAAHLLMLYHEFTGAEALKQP